MNVDSARKMDSANIVATAMMTANFVKSMMNATDLKKKNYK